MELLFESVQLVGSGANPSAIHTPENIVQVIFTDNSGKIYAKDASTPMGEWTDREFTPAYLLASDVDVEHMKLNYGANAIFIVWKNNAEEGETVPYIPGAVHAFRHRIAVWVMRQDLSKYLISGNIDLRMNDPVTRLSMSFENPKFVVSHENETILTPGTALTLFFKSGDSARYIMGRYFVDRNNMGVLEGATDIEASNAIGKLLRDQTFDEDNTYPKQNLEVLGKAIMDNFGVINYFVSPSVAEIGMQFPPEMSGLEGFQELINTVPAWKIAEDLSGRIGFGDKNDPMFTPTSVYTFYRDTDIFSRNVARDDQDAYSRVCVHDKNRLVQVYKDVNFKFVMGRKKTLHVAVAEGTLLADATIYATELAALLSNVGTIETFTGPFKPYLLVGDEASIVSYNNTKSLGLITSVTHKFGKTGFTTDFVVDSGSTANKTRISDYITKITGRQATGQATRLY